MAQAKWSASDTSETFLEESLQLFLPHKGVDSLHKASRTIYSAMRQWRWNQSFPHDGLDTDKNDRAPSVGGAKMAG